MKRKNLFCLLLCVFALFMSAGVFAGKFNVKNSVFAENANFFQDLQTELAILPDSYNGQGANSFTPFDFETGERMQGQSLRPEVDQNNSFSLALELGGEQIDVSLGLEIGLWVYFSTKNLHNLRFTFYGQDQSAQDVEFYYTINSEVLKDNLQKQGNNTFIDGAEDGYSWNYLQIPLNLFTNGSSENVFSLNSLQIDYFSSTINSDVDYAYLYLYDISINQSNNIYFTILEQNKQPFRLVGFDFYTQDELNQVYLGDTLSINSRTSMLKYAWVGDQNIKTYIDANDNSYNVRVKVVDVDGGETLWEFMSSHTFNKTGSTIVKFEINKDDEEILWQAFNFNVTTFNGIYFNQNITEFEEGKTIRIYLRTNQNLTQLDNLNFEIVGECAKIKSVDLENCYVDIETLSDGSFVLRATANGSRLFDPSINLSCEKEFSVVSANYGQNDTLKILMYVALGLIVGCGAVWGIWAIVKANKYKVK